MDTNDKKQIDEYGYQDQWASTDNGEHYFIRDGEPLEQAYERKRLSRMFSSLPNALGVANRVLSITENDNLIPIKVNLNTEYQKNWTKYQLRKRDKNRISLTHPASRPNTNIFKKDKNYEQINSQPRPPLRF